MYLFYWNLSFKEFFLVMVYIYGGGYEVGIFVVSLGDVIFLWGVVLVII